MKINLSDLCYDYIETFNYNLSTSEDYIYGLCVNYINGKSEGIENKLKNIFSKKIKKYEI